jgi:hypothetical protein
MIIQGSPCGSGVNLLGNDIYINISGLGNVALSFNSDGTTTATKNIGGQVDGYPVWWLGTGGTGAGTNYWIKFHLLGGSGLAGTFDTWLQLSSNRQISQASGPAGAIRVSTCQVDIAEDAGGSNILATKTWTLNVGGNA